MEYNLSTKVKELCKDRGIQLKDLAMKMNIAPESLTRTLRGNPQLSTLNNIASALQIELSELFNDNPKGKEALQAIIIFNGITYTANDLASLQNVVEKISEQ